MSAEVQPQPDLWTSFFCPFSWAASFYRELHLLFSGIFYTLIQVEVWKSLFWKKSVPCLTFLVDSSLSCLRRGRCFRKPPAWLPQVSSNLLSEVLGRHGKQLHFLTALQRKNLLLKVVWQTGTVFGFSIWVCSYDSNSKNNWTARKDTFVSIFCCYQGCTMCILSERM